ncbi:MAG: hypothetical protein R3B98_05165 [Hyphomonas sp.]
MNWISKLFGSSPEKSTAPSPSTPDSLPELRQKENEPPPTWVDAGLIASPGPSPSGKEGRGPDFTQLGIVDSTCASCGTELAKRPGRKTKCPHCREFNYVRKRPLDDERVLLREDEIVELERQWAWARGEGQTFDAQLDRYASKFRELETQFGSPPSAGDVRWGLLNEDIIQLSKRRNWISIRQTYQTMALHLEREGNHRRAVIFFMVVFCYDANGANRPDTSMNWTDRDIRHFGFDPRLDFDLSRAFDSPAMVIGGITSNLEEAGIGLEDAEVLFMTEVSKFVNDRMPLSSKETWAKLKHAISAK